MECRIMLLISDIKQYYAIFLDDDNAFIDIGSNNVCPPAWFYLFLIQSLAQKSVNLYKCPSFFNMYEIILPLPLLKNNYCVDMFSMP